MGDLPKELQQQAVFDSQGQFTINWQEAAAKLARYQLPEPRAYILKLVQWAVASRARWVRVEVLADRVTVRHNGDGMSLRDFEAVFANPMAAGGHLGAGLLAASTLKPRQLIFESQDYRWVDGDSSSGTKAEGSSLSLLGMKPHGWLERGGLVRQQSAQTWAYIDTDGLLGSMLWDAFAWVRPEIALVRQRCILAGVPVFLNGKVVNRPAGLALSPKERQNVVDFRLRSGRPSGSAFCFALAHQWSPGLLLAPGEPSPKIKIHYQDYKGKVGPLRNAAKIGAPLDNVLMNGVPMLTCSAAVYRAVRGIVNRSVIHWVQDGVLISLEALKSNGHYLVYSACTGLQADISGFGLVHDQAYQERVEWLSRLIPTKKGQPAFHPQ